MDVFAYLAETGRKLWAVIWYVLVQGMTGDANPFFASLVGICAGVAGFGLIKEALNNRLGFAGINDGPDKLIWRGVLGIGAPVVLAYVAYVAVRHFPVQYHSGLRRLW